MIKSSAQFVQKLDGLKIGSDSARLYKCDIKHFYMSSSLSEIASDATLLMPAGERKQVLKAAIEYLLYHQYVVVETNTDDDVVWRVKRGSGMGLLHSSAVSRCAYFSKVEHPYSSVERNRQQHGILAVCRYEDDLFIAVDDKENARPFVHKMISLGGYYKLKVEAIGTQLQYLDLNIFIEDLQRFIEVGSPPSLGLFSLITTAFPVLPFGLTTAPSSPTTLITFTKK